MVSGRKDKSKQVWREARKFGERDEEESENVRESERIRETDTKEDSAEVKKSSGSKNETRIRTRQTDKRKLM